jgi:hypothetical protein
MKGAHTSREGLELIPFLFLEHERAAMVRPKRRASGI